MPKNLFLQTPAAGDIEEIFKQGAEELSRLSLPEFPGETKQETPKPEATKTAAAPSAPRRGSAPTAEDIIRRAVELGIDPAVPLAIWGVESGANFNSKDSPKGAVGGMQVMPGTYRMMMGTDEGMRDPWNNMEAALRYIAYGQKKLGTKDPALLAAGYHAGYDREDLKRGVIPGTHDGIMSTRDYAAKVARKVSKTGLGAQPVAAAGEFEELSPEEVRRLGLDQGNDRFEELSPQEVERLLTSQTSAKPATEDRGFFDRAGNAWSRGAEGTLQSLETARFIMGGGDSAELARNLARRFQAEAARPKTEGEQEIDAAFKEVTDAKGAWNTVKAGAKAVGTAITNPKDLAVGIIEQAPNMLPTLGAGVAGAGTGAAVGGGIGAAVGGVGAVPGAVTGAVIGGRAGMVAGTTATELGAEVQEMILKRLTEQKQLPTEQNIKALLDDPQFQAEARKQGLAKGLTVAAIDQVFLGLGGKIAGKAAGATTKTGKVGYGAAAAGIDAAGETTGEAVSQAVARGEVDKGEALREGVYGLGQSTVEPVIGYGLSKAGQAARALRDTPAQPQQPTATPAQPTAAPAQPATTPAPAQPTGPIGRALQKATGADKPQPAPDAVELPRVRITDANGQAITGFAEQIGPDGSGRVIGDDGQVYQFTAQDGVSIEPIDQPAAQAPAAPAQAAQPEPAEPAIAAVPEPVEVPVAEDAPPPAAPSVEPAAESAAPAVQPGDDAPWTKDGHSIGVKVLGIEDRGGQPYARVQAGRAETYAPVSELTKAPKVEVVEPDAVKVEPQEVAKPAKAADRPLTEWTEQELRDRLRYLTSQAKMNGGWNSTMAAERRKVSAEIDRRNAQGKESAHADVRVRDDGAARAEGAEAQRAGQAGRRPADAQPADGRVAQPAGSAVPAAGNAVPGADQAADAQPALTDPAAGRWFGSREKAEAFIAKKGLTASHEVVQTGKVRFEVKPKAPQAAAGDGPAATDGNARPAPAAPGRLASVIDNSENRKGEHIVRASDGTNLATFHIGKDGRPVRVKHFYEDGGTRRLAEDAIRDFLNDRAAAAPAQSATDSATTDAQQVAPPPAPEQVPAEASRPADDGVAQWNALTPAGRRAAMNAAGVKLPDAVMWEHISDASKQKLRQVVSNMLEHATEPQAAPAPPPARAKTPIARLQDEIGRAERKMENLKEQARKARAAVNFAKADEINEKILILQSEIKGMQAELEAMQAARGSDPAGAAPAAQAAPAPTATQAEPAPVSDAGKADPFAGNKLFTSDKVAAARERLRKKLSGSQLNSGIDPELLMDGMTIAGAYIEAGVRSFADYAKRMVQDMGDGVKPYLLSFWEAARNYPGLDTKGMTSVEESKRLHEQMLAPEAKILAAAQASPKIGAKERAHDDGQATAGAAGDGAQEQGAGSVQPDAGGRDAEVVSGGPDGRDAGGDQRGAAGRDRRPGERGEPDVRARSARQDAGDQHGDEGGRGDRAGAGDRDDRGPVSRVGDNYRIQPGELKRAGSWRATAEQNVRIVELVKQLEREGRRPTPEEAALLTKFTGWGATEIANGIFPDRYGRYKDATWQALGERLKAALTPEEYAQARRTTQYAHYTSEGVIRSIYDGLRRLGFAGGRVLEPGMGIGLFNGLMPADMAASSQYTGIEYDSITGAIAKLLYPQSNIIVGDYTKTALPREFFDAAIGNPPFGSIAITNDPEYKKHGFMLHDYFFAKTIDRVKPGGLLVFVTSKGTMDKANDLARKYLAERADLLGAVRLPQTAFKDNAGTEVVTDVLFLRKRMPGEKVRRTSAGAALYRTNERGEAMGQPVMEVNDWLGLAEVQTPQGPATINEYFAAHPEMVLGAHALTGSMYRANEYTVVPEPGVDLEQAFARAVANLPEGVYRPGAKNPVAAAAVARERDFNPTHKKEGGLYVAEDGRLMQVENGTGVELTHRRGADGKLIALKPNDKAFLKSWVGLRDALKQAQLDQLTDGDWEKSLKALAAAYDAFVAKHGNLLAYSSIERENEDGTVTVTKRFKNDPLLRLDVDGALAYSLEHIKETGEIVKAPVLSQRVLQKRREPEIKTTQDALFVSLNALGRLDLDDVARRAGMSRQEVIDALGAAIYEAPGEGWQTADEYLSGNVVRKLKEAEAAARTDKRYQRNVEALLAVQPKPLGPTEITVKLGQNWIPPSDIEQFASEVLKESISVSYNPRLGTWSAEQNGSNYSEFNTPRMSAGAILDAVLNNRTIRVTYRDQEGKTHVDAEATEKANDVARKMREAFSRWIWTDTKRADRLVNYYNEHFNNIAPRRYDGSHLTLPGVSLRFNLYPHQKRAVWRIIQEGDTYLAHSVGSGKTIEMIASAMEQRRLGLIKKPIMVVPNHMLAQFAREFLELYPAANIMVADEQNFHTHNRRRFVAQAALNDLDAIIITHSAFSRIGMSDEFADRFITDQIEEWKRSLDETDQSDRITRKQIERRIEQLERRLEARQNRDKKDAVVTFEELGADLIYVDECFTYDTLVETDLGLLPIGRIVEEKLQVRVKSLNPGTHAIEWKPITNWYRHARKTRLIEVFHENGSFICTPNHNIWTDAGYVKAGHLKPGTELRVLRSGIYSELHREAREEGAVLFGGMPGGGDNREQDLPGVRRRLLVPNEGGGERREADLLFDALRAEGKGEAPGVHGGVEGQNEADVAEPADQRPEEPGLGGADAPEQSDEISADAQEGFGITEGAGAQAGFARREWVAYGAAGAAGEQDWVDYRVRGDDSAPAQGDVGAAEFVQGGPGLPGVEVGGGDRRPFAPHVGGERAGRQEGQCPGVTRVVRVEVLEQGGDGEYRFCGRDHQFVYDIEVEGNHNYFANGVLVSNSHEYRKLDFATNQGNIKGIDPAGSQRAMDMFMKVQYLRSKKPGRALVMASGTPITNTMGELFTVQRFFQPDQLAEDGLDTFDAWANQYGDVVAGFEQNAAGGYEVVSRFAKFQNVPELMRRVRSFMDILTSSSLGELVQRPAVKGGGREIVVTPEPDGYRAYQKTLEARINAIRQRKGPPKKGEDIILNVIADGRFSAIDMRFVDPSLPPDPKSKLNKALDDLIAAYFETKDYEYTTNGQVDPIKGSSLILFTDIGLGEQSAKSRGFDMKAWIEKRLTDAGIPREHIAFMRDHKEHAKKERLFADMREGKKRILIGGKDMETGVNVQKRLTHLFHLDAPWFPSSVEQREGRIVRQGNQNKEVVIRAYATKGSYDSTMWGMNGRKARFIEQALNGDDSVRSLEDVSEASAFEMAAALASGDERYLRLAGLKADVERLQRLAHAHHDDQNKLRRDKLWAESKIERDRALVADLKAAIERRTPIRAGEFAGKVGRATYDKRDEFSNALFERFKALAATETRGEETIGEIGGFPITFYGVFTKGSGNYYATVEVVVPGDPDPLLSWPLDPQLAVGGLATRAANQVNALDRQLAEAEDRVRTNERRIEQIDQRLGAPFPEQADLLDNMAQLQALEIELTAEKAAEGGQPVAALRDQAGVSLSIDDGNAIADTATYGPASPEHQQLADTIAGRLSRAYGRAIVLDAVAPGSGAVGGRGRELAAVSTVARRLFGHEVVFVRFKGKPLFNGAMSTAIPDVLFINADATKPLMAVLGHELLHHLKRTNEGIYNTLNNRLNRLKKSERDYLHRLEVLYGRQGAKAPANWDEELNADIVGDFFMDPEFWAAMAKNQPGLFRRVANAIVKFLDDVAAKIAGIRPFGTDQYLTDIAAARAAVVDAMRQFSGAQVGAMTSQSEGINLSVAGLPDTITVDGAQRPTRSSNGQPIAATEEGVRNFWRWFGDSKVADDQGRPLVVYHGTRADFSEFDPDRIGQNFAESKGGFFFTGSQATASAYASVRGGEGGNVMPAYLSLQNPLTLDTYLWATGDTIESALTDREYKLIDLFDEDPAGVIAYAKDGGHDGIFWKNGKDVLAVAFDPAQIKSATGNRGTFDAGSPDIRFSIAPEDADKALDAAAKALDAAPPVPRDDYVGRVVSDLSLGARLIVHPRTIAATFKEFAPVYNTAISQIETRDRHIAELGRGADAYTKLPQESKERVNKVLELGRLTAKTYTEQDLADGVSNPGHKVTVVVGEDGKPRPVREPIKALLTEVGEVVRLTEAEIKAYLDLRGMFDQALDKFRDQTLAEFGFEDLDGQPDAAKAIRGRITKDMDDAERERLESIANFIGEIEQAKRTGYVPFARYGDYVVTVKEKVADLEFVEDDAGHLIVKGVPAAFAGDLAALGATEAKKDGGWRIKKSQRRDVERLAEKTVYSAKVETGLADLIKGRKAGKVDELPAVKAAIEQARKALVEGHPNRRIVAFRANQKQPDEAVRLSDVDALAEVANIDNATWDAVRDKLATAIQGRSFRKHFFQSDNVPGYTGDFERAIADYVIGMSGYLARREHQKRWDNALDRIPGDMPKLHQYASRYRDYVNSPQEEFAMVRQVGFFSYIAGVAATAFANLTQVPLLTVPTLAQVAPAPLVLKEVGRAYKDAIKMLSRKDGLDLFDPNKAPDDVRATVKEAWDEGAFVPLETFDLMMMARQRNVGRRRLVKGFNDTTKVVSLFFTFAERLNRLVTFIAAARLSEKRAVRENAKRVLGRDALARSTILRDWTAKNFAEWAVDESQYRMGKANRPTATRGVGSAITQFKGFMLQTFEAWYRMAALHGKEGKFAAASSLVMLYALAGVWGLPGAEDLRKLIEAAYKALTDRDLNLKTELRAWVARASGSNVLAQAVTKGASYPLGVDMTRVGMGTVLPDSPLAAAGIPFDMLIGRPKRAFEKASTGDHFGAAGELSPNFLKHWLVAGGWATGGVRDKKGDLILPADRLETGDLVMKWLGFQPSIVTDVRDYNYAQYRQETAVDGLKRRFTARIARTLVEMERAGEAGDTKKLEALEAELAGIYDELAEHNESAPPEHQIQLGRRAIANRMMRERDGVMARWGKERRAARGAAEELRGVFGLSEEADERGEDDGQE